MSDANFDKDIQEHLKKIFEQYKVDISDAQKEEILLEFERFKVHKNQFKISVPDLIKNKTFLYITASILVSFILIYLWVYYFPKNHNEKNDLVPKENSSYDDSYKDTIISNNPVSSTVDAVQNQPALPAIKDSINKNNRSVNLNADNQKKNIEGSVIVRKKDTTQGLSNPSAITKADSLIRDSTSVMKKRRKKKKPTEDNIENAEINSVLEPQPPKFNNKTEEE